MIHFLYGTLLEIEKESCILLTDSGIGYGICLHRRFQGTVGEKIGIFTHLISYSDGQQLFGFLDEHEKKMFSLLISVQGVGGRVAQHLLGLYPTKALALLILSKQHQTLKEADGIGPKLAQRIVHELSDKIPLFLSHLNEKKIWPFKDTSSKNPGILDSPNLDNVKLPENQKTISESPYVLEDISLQNWAKSFSEDEKKLLIQHWPSLDETLEKDLISALKNLGYRQEIILKALSEFRVRENQWKFSLKESLNFKESEKTTDLNDLFHRFIQHPDLQNIQKDFKDFENKSWSWQLENFSKNLDFWFKYILQNL